MSLFFMAVLAQLVVIAIIVFILKQVLDNMLIDLSVSLFEVWRPEQKFSEPVYIISHRRLKDKYRSRLDKAAGRHSIETTRLQYQIDKKILGGIIIKAGHKLIDCSLKDRLRQALPWLFRQS